MSPSYCFGCNLKPVLYRIPRVDITSAIDGIEQLRGGTRIDLALETVDTMFSRRLGAREDASRATILLTGTLLCETMGILNSLSMLGHQ